MPGPAAGVTMSNEGLGASLTETTRFVGGAWHPNGNYGPFTAGQHESSEDVTAIVGYRPIVPLELSLEAAVGHQSFNSPDFHTARTVFGESRRTAMRRD